MATTIEVKVRYNYDEDIYFLNGAYTRGNFNYNVAFGEYGGGSEIYNACYMFKNVVIPKGSVITNAYIKGISDSNISQYAHVKLSAVNSATVSMPTTKAAYDALPITPAVTWDILTAWVSMGEYSSPDISSCIQPLVNLADWASTGNDVQILIKDNASTSGYKSFITDTTLMPSLVVTYTDTVAPTVLNASVAISASSNLVASGVVYDITNGLYSDIENANYSSLELLAYSEVETFKLSVPIYCSVALTATSSVVGNCRKVIVGVVAITASSSLSAIHLCKKMVTTAISATGLLSATCCKVFRNTVGITDSSSVSATAVKVASSQANISASSSGSFSPTKIVRVLTSTAITAISSAYGTLTNRIFGSVNVYGFSSLSATALVALLQDFHTFYIGVTTYITNYINASNNISNDVSVCKEYSETVNISISTENTINIKKVDDITMGVHRINEVIV